MLFTYFCYTLKDNTTLLWYFFETGQNTAFLIIPVKENPAARQATNNSVSQSNNRTIIVEQFLFSKILTKDFIMYGAKGN